MEPLEPYRPPHAELSSPTGSGNGPGVSPAMVESLRKTRPWVLLLGVLGMFMSALIILVAIFMAVIGAASAFGEELAGLPSMGIGLFYLLLAVLYFFPSLTLLRYGGAIRRISGTSSTGAIEEALGLQASFWRFIGIMAVAMIVLYGLIFVGAMIFALVAGSG